MISYGNNAINFKFYKSYLFLNEYTYRPRGKKSTEVRKSQIKGKESENSYQELKRSQGTGTHKHTETESRYFDWRGRLPQSKESKCL